MKVWRPLTCGVSGNKCKELGSGWPVNEWANSSLTLNPLCLGRKKIITTSKYKKLKQKYTIKIQKIQNTK